MHLFFKTIALIIISFNSYAFSANDAFMYATQNNDINTLQKLLNSGVNVNIKDKSKNTGYCYAYANKSLSTLSFLEKNGAKTNVKCNINGNNFKTESISETLAAETSKQGFVDSISRDDFYNPEIVKEGSYHFTFPSFAGLKPYALWGLAGVGVAAAAGGGGGGGSSSGGSGSSGDITSPPSLSNIDTSAFETAEFYGNASGAGLSEASDSEYLNIIHSQYAYARGYTGQGELVAVLDTGIDLDNTELASNIYADLTNTDMQDGDNDPSHGITQDDHGTLVSSIIAASKNDNIVHGVAYNAEIIPYRIGDSSGPKAINGSLIDDAINDAISKGAGIFNLSFGRDADINENATTVTKDELEGYFTGFINGDDNTNTAAMNTFISNVTNNNGIIVMAAGNDDYSQPSVQNALPLHYTEFKDHFVTVVALNEAGTEKASYSNECGVAKNHCISAPGTLIIMTNNSDSYELNSGTSFAAPTVSGSIAIIQEAFGLSSDKTLNILFSTATDMGSAGVDDIYGHGLVNLDAATTPGVEVNAVNSVSSVSFNNTNVQQSQALSNLQVPTFVVEDELYRTFKITANGLMAAKDDKLDLSEKSKTFAQDKKIVKEKLNNNLSMAFISSNNKSSVLDNMDYLSFTTQYNNTDVSFGFTSQPGLSENQIKNSNNLLDDKAISNPYISLAANGFNATTKHNLTDDITFKTNVFIGDIENSDKNNLGKANAALVELGYKYNDKTNFALESGMINEKTTLLGSKFSGALALGENNYTYFTGLKAESELTDKTNIFANAYAGLTQANTVTNSLISDVSNITSYSFALGAEHKLTKKSKAGFVFSKPLSINNGSVSYDYVSGGNIDKGYEYATAKSNLQSNAQQLDLQAFYKQNLQYNAKFSAGLMHSFNAENIAGKQDSALLVKYGFDF